MRIETYLWDILEGIIFSHKKKIGRSESNNKKAFEGMLYVLKNGIPWHASQIHKASFAEFTGRIKEDVE